MLLYLSGYTVQKIRFANVIKKLSSSLGDLHYCNTLIASLSSKPSVTKITIVNNGLFSFLVFCFTL